MTNLTEDGNHTTDETFYCTVAISGTQQSIFLSTLNILISITVFLGNTLIIVALKKGFVPSFVVKAFVSLPCLHRSLSGPDFTASSHYIFTVHRKSQILLLFWAHYIHGSCGFLWSLAIDVDCTKCGQASRLVIGVKIRHVVTLRRVQVVVVLSWLSNGATTMTYLYNDILTVAIVCSGLLLCLITSTCCYTNIHITLHHHQAHVQVHDVDDQEESNKVETDINIAKYKKTVSSAMWVQMALVVCYLPFGIATLVIYLSETYPPSLALVWELTLFLLTFNSSLNLVLYCWKIRGVRQAVNERIRKPVCPVRLTVPLA